MSFQIELDKYDRAYGHFLHKIQTSIQQTFAEEEEERGLTQADIARELDIDKASVSRRLNGAGNITLRTISDLFTAMDREPLSNFIADGSFCPYAIGGPPTVNLNLYLGYMNYDMCAPMPLTIFSHVGRFNHERINSYSFGYNNAGLFPRTQCQAVANRLTTTPAPVSKEYQYND